MDIESYNTRQANSLKNNILPSGLQVMVYVLFSIALLMVMNIGAIWNFINSSVGVSSDTANIAVADQFSRFSDFTNGLFHGRLAPMLFWACIGMITYMIVWLIQNAAANVSNDLEAEKFNHPIGFDRQRYWHSIASHKIFLVFSGLIAGVFLYLCVANFFPLTAKVFYASIYDWHWATSPFRLVADICLTVVFIYTLMILLRMARNSWRLITTNL